MTHQDSMYKGAENAVNAKNLSIGVFCASSLSLDEKYKHCAEQLGREMAGKNYTLIFGGTNTGLMGIIAKAVHQHGGKVIGVLPALFHEKAQELGLAYTQADELILTKDMRERKTIMEQQSDAFIVLPGGFGTLEEAAEILTLKQVGYHSKPLLIVNIHGFYDRLIKFFDTMCEQKFVEPSHCSLYTVVPDVKSALSVIANQLNTTASIQTEYLLAAAEA